MMDIALLLLQITLSGVTATHALIYKRDSRSAISWIALCIVLPFFGAFLYYTFGINRVAYKAQHLADAELSRKRLSFKNYSDTPVILKKDLARTCESVPSAHFGIVSQNVSDNKWHAGNSFELLINGEQTYPAMLQAIHSAEHSIYLMTYIFTTGKFGRDFIQALKQAKDRGVDVKVIVDSVASLYSIPTASRLLKKAGIKVISFTTSRFFPPSFGLNLRNHKKLLLIDGHTLFTGGMNIRGINYIDDPKNKNPKKDTHFKLCGPIVHDGYKEFQRTWHFLSKDVISIPEPLTHTSGETYCKLITDGPDEALDKIELIFIDAIVSARHSIKIVTPYFIPSRDFISALNTAALRGINVEIILPEKSDSRIADYATRNMLWELLQRGVEVYYQRGAFDHSKLFMADSEYTLIGSANIDPRSLRLNYELLVEIVDPKAVSQLDQLFAKKLSNSIQVELKSLESRSLIVRIRDSMCWLCSPYL